MKKLKSFLLLFNLTWKICPYRYFSTLLDSLLSVGQTLIYVFLPKYIIDALVSEKSWREILMSIAIFIGSIAVLKTISLITRPWVNACVNRSGIDTVNHYMELSAHTQYSTFETATYRNKLQSAMGNVRGETAADFCATIISAIVSLVIYTIFIASLNPVIFIIVLAVVIVNTIIKLRLNRLEETTVPDFQRNSREFSYINDALSGFDNAKEVRINQIEGLFDEKYKANLDRRWKLNTSYGRKKLLLNMISYIANAVQLVVVYGYTGYMTWGGSISLGSFTAYAASVINFSNAFSTLINAFLDIDLAIQFVPLYCEVRELAQESEMILSDCEIKRPIEIKFENVSFCYPKTDKMVLKNINLTLSDGCKLAVVGENGAGKTTFIKLLCRLYTPTCGRITLNGIDIDKIPREIYSKLLSVVFQDFKLFSFDVSDNIVLNAEFDDKKMNDVIDRSDLRHKIDSLENGIHTFINREFDEHGVEFSGGEAQKLALARAYYKNSPIVILDEPTAALDPKSEIYLYEHFQSIIKGKSAIFISHRLASTAFCDKIAVFSAGQIVEIGTHGELLDLKGIYAKMWNIQAELYAQKGEA